MRELSAAWARIVILARMKKQFCFVQMLLIIMLSSLADLRGQAQSSQGTPAPAPPQANASDVDTVEHIVGAVYASISGPAGPRNWDRFQSLFYPGARLIPSHRDQTGKVTANNLTVDQYAERAKTFFDKEGFYESPVANRTEVWDHIAHVWSTYESRHAKGENPFARGINSFQLLYDGSRWWIVTIYWEGEDPGHLLPEKYLK